jgi:hypothetical protein
MSQFCSPRSESRGKSEIMAETHTGRCDRGYCTKCSGHVMLDHPTLGLADVRIGALRNFPFKPKVHLNYQETVLPMRDGLPKLRDFPSAIGGSGETLPE